MTRPACHNRPAFTDPRAGWQDTGTMRVNLMCRFDEPLFKPVLRYRWPWFEDRCAVWDGTGIAGPGAIHAPYPIAMGYDCRGCRLLTPENARALDQWNSAAYLSGLVWAEAEREEMTRGR